MKNKKGFTINELMIILAIFGILAAIIIPNIAKKKLALENATPPDIMQRTLIKKVKLDTNIVYEVRCIEGYMFVRNYDGILTQIIDSNGNGIYCN